MMLSLDTAYRSFGGEVEASSTPTICRLSDSRRHQLSAIARTHASTIRLGKRRVTPAVCLCVKVSAGQSTGARIAGHEYSSRIAGRHECSSRIAGHEYSKDLDRLQGHCHSIRHLSRKPSPCTPHSL